MRNEGIVQFSSVAQSCPTLCNPKDCSTPGLPVHHHLLELAQAHVHWVGDAIQPSHPLSSPSPPAFNLSQHQGLFQWVSSSQQVAQRGHIAGRKFRAECSLSIGVPGIKVSLTRGVTLSFLPGFIAVVLSNGIRSAAFIASSASSIWPTIFSPLWPFSSLGVRPYAKNLLGKYWGWVWGKAELLKLQRASTSPGEFEKIQVPGPHPQGFWFSRSGVGLRTCISAKCLCPRPNFEKLLCDIMIHDKKHMFSLCPYLWHRAAKTLDISCDESNKGISWCVNEVTVGPTKGWRLVANGANHEIETWNFQLHPDLRKEKLEIEFSDQWCNQAYLCNEAAIKTQKDGFGELSGSWTWMLPCTTVLDPKLHRGRSLFVWSLTLYVSSSGCWFVSLNILCDKPVI